MADGKPEVQVVTNNWCPLRREQRKGLWIRRSVETDVSEPDTETEPTLPVRCGTGLAEASEEAQEAIFRSWAEAEARWLAWYVLQDDSVRSARAEQARTLAGRVLRGTGHVRTRRATVQNIVKIRDDGPAEP